MIFIGAQAAGKSTFYQQHFAATHLRINLDMLRTRYRERTIMQACLAVGQPLVLDTTNVTMAERAVYFETARPHGFRMIGYFFQSRAVACAARNAGRSGAARVPNQAIFGTIARLQMPTYTEGFVALYYVRIDADGSFVVEEWRDAV